MTSTINSDRVIRALYQITNNYQAGFSEQIQQLIKLGLERFNLDIGILSHVKGDLYTVVECITPNGVELHSGDSFAFAETYCSVTCQADAPVAIEYAKNDDRLATHPAYKAFGLESYIGIPIHVNGKLYGTLNFSSAAPYPRKFEEIDIDALQLMASWISVELIRRSQEKKLAELNRALAEQAYYDSLTGLANRRNMFKHLKRDFNQQLRKHQTGVLALVDIDHFKKLNDTYGHSTGDEALKVVADGLATSVRDGDFVARYGGEEFVLWLPSTDRQHGLPVLERIMATIRRIKMIETPITISIGAHVVEFFDDKNYKFSRFVDTNLELADKALYHAKNSGRDRICFSEEACTDNYCI